MHYVKIGDVPNVSDTFAQEMTALMLKHGMALNAMEMNQKPFHASTGLFSQNLYIPSMTTTEFTLSCTTIPPKRKVKAKPYYKQRQDMDMRYHKYSVDTYREPQPDKDK